MICSFAGCGQAAVLQWIRQMTAAELAIAQANVPNPVLVTAENSMVAVFGCAAHQISADLACLCHQSTCSAPPTCNCSPMSDPNPGIVKAP